ncbi:MAG: 3-deoxy-manno-octulosonate cytidylyltransferase [Ignavibacteriae bacterium]|nr:3-deoxy-manno-octulosonate cytidylyltransferase [Ignavibacteriota bacterium]
MFNQPHVVAVIPARGASRRLAAKPLIDLCGKPMIQHVYERVQMATLVDRVTVATDNERIAETVRKFGGEVIMTPSEIHSGSDRVAHVARYLTDADIVVNLQGDEPLIAPQMIDEAIRPMTENLQQKSPHKDFQVGTLARKITSAEELHNPNVVKVVIDIDGFAIFFSRSPIPYMRDGDDKNKWHLQHPYYKHIGLYVFKKDFLSSFATWKESALERIERLEQLRIIEHGYNIKVTLTEYDSIPVDTQEDVERVRTLMHQTTVKQ